MRYLIFLTVPLAMVFGGKAIATEPVFETGQIWECTTSYRSAPPGEKIEFMVTGIATKREVSRRPNFQTDEPVIGVALIDRNPDACPQVQSFPHMAYTATALLACDPNLVGNYEGISSNYWRKVRDARGRWLIGMQSNKGVVIELSPSKFLMMLRGDRC